MINDGSYFVMLDTCSARAMRARPKDVYPFDYLGIELFAHESRGLWAATEKSTGCLIGRGMAQEDAVLDAQANINTMGADWVRNQIINVLARLAQGSEYDYDQQAWKTPVVQEVKENADD
jgi:hypothetical protein